MHIDDYLDYTKLEEYLKEGYVTKRSHLEFPLDIYCYSRKTIWEDFWDDVTTKTRGLIVNSKTLDIVSRPWEKFFNIDTFGRSETYGVNLVELPRPMITDKVDGSLGIRYTFKGHTGVATKGSFTSFQAEWATMWLNAHGTFYYPWDWTALYEIIAEGIQHHVVHYGSDRLILIGMIHNETGEEMEYKDLMKVARNNLLEVVQAHNISLTEAIAQDRPNKEGFVATWPWQGQPPVKIKIKHKTFLKNQVIMHTATPKRILQVLSSGNPELIDTWLSISNNAVRDYISKWIGVFNDEYHYIFRRSHVLVFEGLQTCTTRKDFAEFLKRPQNLPYMSVCFSLLDNTSNKIERYKALIWKMVGQRVDMKSNDPEIDPDIDLDIQLDEDNDDDEYLEAA